ncbi:hypothetical protein F5Y03DRAFT_396386 [Xylaria venustula]|nr:hypothetical protein F5Y03DRAFT_396386 [Xylaria venustula]
MTSSNEFPVTFTFHRRGVHPPLFVAGTFSDPPWQAQEMDASIDQHGDYVFTKRAMVKECSEIQYKFRHGSGDWWALDPDADTATDGQGNVNSLLYSPTIKAAQEITQLQEIHATKTENTDATQIDVASPVDTAAALDTDTDTEDSDFSKYVTEQEGLRRLSFTPIEEVASTAAEVADTASQLDVDDELEADDGELLPMFSHECFSASPSCQEPELQPDDLDCSPESLEILGMEFDDPRLEHFPSDRDSIIATMQRVSAAVEMDSTTVDQVSLSSIFAENPSSPSSKRGSITADGLNIEQEQTEDVNREPVSIPQRNSLQSIAEGDESPCGSPYGNEAQEVPTPIEYIGPVERRNFSMASLGSSNDDEGVSMSTASRTKKIDDQVQPTTLHDEATTDITHSTEEDTSIDSTPSKPSEENVQSSLQKPTNGERSHSPCSTVSIRDGNKGDWIRTFFHTVFVDWIGDLFCWLCSRSRSRNQV